MKDTEQKKNERLKLRDRVSKVALDNHRYDPSHTYVGTIYINSQPLGGFKPGLSRKRPSLQILGGIRLSFHLKLQSLV